MFLSSNVKMWNPAWSNNGELLSQNISNLLHHVSFMGLSINEEHKAGEIASVIKSKLSYHRQPPQMTLLTMFHILSWGSQIFLGYASDQRLFSNFTAPGLVRLLWISILWLFLIWCS